MQEEYKTAYASIYLEIPTDIQRTLGIIRSKSFPQGFLDRHLSMLAYDYRDLGIGELVIEENSDFAKQHFYASAKIRESLFHAYDRKTFPTHHSHVVMSSYPFLLLAVLSDSEPLTASLSKLLGGRPKEEADIGHPFANNVGYAVKHILLGQDDIAQQHVHTLEQIVQKRGMKSYQGYALVLRSILEEDADTLHQGLQLMLAAHRKNRDVIDSPEELLCIPAAGLAKIALRRGIPVSIDDPLVPPALLQTHSLEYPKLDFLNELT